VVTPKKKTFGQTVYRLRNKADMTQEALAEKAEISRRYLQMVEAGRYSPTVEVTSRIRGALGAPWDDLMRGRRPTLTKSPPDPHPQEPATSS